MAATAATGRMGDGMLSGLQIASPEFAMNGSITANYTCDGSNVNPPLVIRNVP
jgi:phosphatidylethanolamine-binding protein (PEBP) family uncharacterized protein